MAHVLVDDFFMGQEENKVLPMIGLKEPQSKMKFARHVEEKGPNEYAIDAIKEDIQSLGVKRFIFKSDQDQQSWHGKKGS